jgi:hypothetical protein
MIPYDSILQMVNGKVYSMHHLWSSFHLHQPDYEAIQFYAVSPNDREVVVAQLEHGTSIYHDVPTDVIAALDNETNVEQYLAAVISGGFKKEDCDGYITEVPIQDVLDTFCHMQDFIAISSGLWATDVPERFKDHPAYELLFRLKYNQPE